MGGKLLEQSFQFTWSFFVSHLRGKHKAEFFILKMLRLPQPMLMLEQHISISLGMVLKEQPSLIRK